MSVGFELYCTNFSPFHFCVLVVYPTFELLALRQPHLPQVATCDYHTAVVTSNGQLYTCGAKENGKLGHGSQGPSGSLGRITRVTKFLDSDEQTDMDVKVGYVRKLSFQPLRIFIAFSSTIASMMCLESVSQLLSSTSAYSVNLTLIGQRLRLHWASRSLLSSVKT